MGRGMGVRQRLLAKMKAISDWRQDFDNLPVAKRELNAHRRRAIVAQLREV